MRILTSRIAHPSRWKLWNLTVEDGKDWGRHLTIHSSEVVQWSIGMYARLLKKLPKAVLELPFLRGCLPAFVLGLRVYRHCTLIFLAGVCLAHHHLRVLAPSAKVGFAVAAILAILQGLYHTYRRKRSDNPRIGIVIWPG